MCIRDSLERWSLDSGPSRWWLYLMEKDTKEAMTLTTLGSLSTPLNSYLHRVLSGTFPYSPKCPQPCQALHPTEMTSSAHEFQETHLRPHAVGSGKGHLHSPRPRSVGAPERRCSAAVKGTEFGSLLQASTQAFSHTNVGKAPQFPASET